MNRMQHKNKSSNNKMAVSRMDVALNVIGGKWKMLVLVALMEKPQRTSNLQKLLPYISERILIRQFRELEKHLLITRKVFASVPPNVEYTITDYGKTLRPVIQQLSTWGFGHVKKIYPRKNIDYRVERFEFKSF
jgi:DNA-binding HxlR family transcriptional regulator